jgi:peptidyl-Lys metalloendopeptidase
MLKRKQVLFVLALALILAFSSLGASNGSAVNSGAVVTVSAGQAAFTADQSVMVQVTISNPTGKPVKVLKWFTPVEDVEEPLFAVTVDGAPVSYIGALYKRPAPAAADYVTLKAGESFTRTVDLGAYYDLSVSGTYTVRYDVASPDLSSEKGDGSAKNAARLVSNELKLTIEGRQAPAPEVVTLAGVTGTTTYNKCTTAQQSTLVQARAQASTYSADALAYLNANKQGSRYTTWFGVYLVSRYTTVKSHFSAISNAMATAPVTIDCSCKKKYYAYVYPTKPYVIYVCSVFWTAPLTGTDSKAGTLIHEMSHFTVVAGTNDYVYGQTGAKALAISNPNNAINNADNHEYFAENTPTLP